MFAVTATALREQEHATVLTHQALTELQKDQGKKGPRESWSNTPEQTQSPKDGCLGSCPTEF